MAFAIHWACLFSLALCVWLFVFVARVVWRVFSPFPSLSPPTLAYFCWLLSPGCSLGARHRSQCSVAATSSDLLGGATGDERGGRQPPTPTQAIYYILYSLAHDTSDANDQHSSCDVHGDCATSHALMSAVTVVRMNRPVDSLAKCLSRASNHRESSRLRRSSL